MTSARTICVLALIALGCGDERRSTNGDAGSTDARVDSGSSDARVDSAASDAGKDSGSTDAGKDSGGTGNDAGSGDAGTMTGEPTGLIGITAAHNTVRANATPTPSPALPALTWSSTVAATAQAWANGCVYNHSGNAYGENIYASTGTPTAQGVVNSWASEASSYNYAANTCSGTCGHYTQVVWRSSTQLGCGIKACTTNSPFNVAMYGPNWTLVVCDYNPAGNNGSRPY